MNNIKIAKFTPVVIAVFAVLYILMAIFLPDKSCVWDRMVTFAPYVFGSNAIVELLVGINKLKEKGLK